MKCRAFDFYILSDTEKKVVEVFGLSEGKYKQKNDTNFRLTPQSNIELDVFNLWQSMQLCTDQFHELAPGFILFKFTPKSRSGGN